MTTLDDALNSSTPLFAPPTLLVTWAETPPTESAGVENLYDMSDMLEGSFTVEQSFDDALPDPVTMTTSNDASGTFEATLIGREGIVVSTSTTTGTTAVSNDYSSQTVMMDLPGGATHGDYIVSSFIIPAAGVLVAEQYDNDLGRAWTKLAQVSDGVFTMYVYGRVYYNGMEDPYFFWSNSPAVSYAVWTTTAYRATSPNGAKLAWKISQTFSGTAPSSISAHALGSYTIPPRGYAQAVIGGPAGITYTNTGLGTIAAQDQTVTCSMALVRSALNTTDVQFGSLSVTSSAAITDAMYYGFVIEPFIRPRLTPTQFWSPFNPDSPVAGFDRDTAGIDFQWNTITAAGIEPTQIFTGIMNDVALRPGQSVELSAVSRTRINLNRSVNLPMVFGRRENCTVDYLVTWLLARADRFFGPAPSYMSRYWVPMYGSVHAAQDADKGYNFAMHWGADGNNIGTRYPRVIPGPFHTAMFACQRTDLVERLVINAIDLYKSTEVVPPWVAENYNPSQYLVPQWGWNGGAGRVSFWIKADPWATTGLPGTASNFVFNFYTQVKDKTGAVLGKVGFWIDNNGIPAMGMGNDAVGGLQAYVFSGQTMPQDGNWHFYSVYWSWFDGEMGIMKDGSKTYSTVWDTNGYNTTPNWLNDDAAFYAAGGVIDNAAWFQLPASDFLIESGYDVYDLYFSDQWPTTPWPSFTAYARPTYSPLEAVSGDSPVNAWDTLADLARNTMSMYRGNEWDGFEFFPPTYFGEAAQLTPDLVADTEVNAQDLAVTVDPSKSRNVVTVTFEDTKVDQSYSTCFALQSATEIPRGVSVQTFTLDVPIAEIHGASAPYDPWWTLTNGTAAQVTAGTQPSNVHYMFVNTKSDGSGTYASTASVVARIIGYTQTTVTLQFTNKMSVSGWLTNNYSGDNQLPYLRILGYVVRTSDGYLTERDAGSIGTRRERSLEVEMAWIQDRTTAQELASSMVTALARPRQEVEVVVQGDPRRVPGNLVTLVDAQGTQAAGNWRVLSVKHDADGAKYLQTLSLVFVPPVGVWDGLPGWDESIWGV